MRSAVLFAVAVVCSAGCGPSGGGGGRRDCVSAQYADLLNLPPVLGRAGEPLVVTVPSPQSDPCTDLRPQAVTAKALGPSGAAIDATAEVRNEYASSATYLVAEVTFTPPQGGWYALQVDFTNFGGVVEEQVFVADVVPVSETLPFACDSLQRGPSAWLCDDRYVRGVLTVHEFEYEAVLIVDRALWAYDPRGRALRRYLDVGEGELFEDPVVSATLPAESFWIARAASTEQELAVVFDGRLDVYAAPAGGITRIATVASPLLSSIASLVRRDDWFYVVRQDDSICPFRLDRVEATLVPSSCFTVGGELVAARQGGLLIATETTETNDQRVRAHVLDGSGVTTLEDALILPWPTAPDPFVREQSVWEWQYNSNHAARLFALTVQDGTLRFAELPLHRYTCYSPCRVYPNKTADFLYWPESASTKIVYTP